MNLSSFTCLAFLINRVIDAGPDRDLSYDEIFEAARDRHLIWLLTRRFSHIGQFSFVTHPGIEDIEQMDAALRDAAASFEGRVGKPSGPVSGLCLALDIVLEAIQQQLYRPTGPQPEPDLAPAHPFLPFVNRSTAAPPPPYGRI